MSNKNPDDYDPFPKLDFYAIKRNAVMWAEQYPDIQKICLYHSNTDIAAYVFVIQIPALNLYPSLRVDQIFKKLMDKNKDIERLDSDEFKRLEKKLLKKARFFTKYRLIKEQPSLLGLISYFNWRYEDCSHIQPIEFQTFYKTTPPGHYRDEWSWFEIEPGENIREYAMVKQADEHDFWLLYEKSTTKTKKKLRPSQVRREKCREIAQLPMYWGQKEENPPTADAIRMSPEVRLACDAIGIKIPAKSTFLKYVSDINPFPRQRPRKSKKVP